MAIKCAVVGLGMGYSHARGYAAQSDAKLVGVCDTDEKRARSVSTEFECKAYSDLGEMLKAETPDIVSIAVPNVLHAPLTIQALKAGAHVLCEKPMAMNAEEACKMLSASEEFGRRLMINFDLMTSPTFSSGKWILAC